MEKFRRLEYLRAQLTVVRWHLDAATTLANGDKKRQHLDSATLAYQAAAQSLAQLALPEAEQAALTTQLAQLKEGLLAAGLPV